jgi:4-diphosphocytidyl-2-C-methyl-D-erythritol kinase
MDWPAPAKLNLFLHIVGRRPDGYHELQTLFQFLDLSDELTYAVRGDGEVCRVNGPAEIDAGQDLAVRAARLLQRRAGTRLGVEIRLRKRIPMGGGLGGGSSDAATTLLALNRLWELGLGLGELAELGLELGADVPVFVRGRAAWAEGVGERLVPVQIEQPWYVVVDPGCHVSTAKIFGHPTLTRDTPRITIPDPVCGAASMGNAELLLGELFERTANDCELLVRECYPAVDAVLRDLSRHGHARLTGTGGCVFVAAANESKARSIAEQLPGDWRKIVARGLNRSPLHDVL